MTTHFKKGGDDVEDNMNRPSTTICKEKINLVQTLIEENWWLRSEPVTITLHISVDWDYRILNWKSSANFLLEKLVLRSAAFKNRAFSGSFKQVVSAFLWQIVKQVWFYPVFWWQKGHVCSPGRGKRRNQPSGGITMLSSLLHSPPWSWRQNTKQWFPSSGSCPVQAKGDQSRAKHSNRFLGCLKVFFLFTFPKNNVCLLWEWFEKVTQSFSRKLFRKTSRGFFSPPWKYSRYSFHQTRAVLWESCWGIIRHVS